MDWPSGRNVRANLCPWDSPEGRCNYHNTTQASVAWPAANRAIFVPVYVEQPCVIKRLMICNGGTIAGNFDIGVYNDNLSLLVSSGSTAQAGSINTPQLVDVTDTPLGIGRYYLAVAMDGVSGTIMRGTPVLSVMRVNGMFAMDTAFPLPATAVPAALVDQLAPYIGGEIVRLV